MPSRTPTPAASAGMKTAPSRGRAATAIARSGSKRGCGSRERRSSLRPPHRARRLYWGMRSVADDLKIESREALASLEPMARIALALALGEQDAGLLACARGITLAQARRRFAAGRALGRMPSVANLDTP